MDKVSLPLIELPVDESDNKEVEDDSQSAGSSTLGKRSDDSFQGDSVACEKLTPMDKVSLPLIEPAAVSSVLLSRFKFKRTTITNYSMSSVRIITINCQ